MSVLVKGMEMPTSCDDCRMSNGIYCYAALDNEYISTNTPKVRPSNCPLIEVPEDKLFPSVIPHPIMWYAVESLKKAPQNTKNCGEKSEGEA